MVEEWWAIGNDWLQSMWGYSGRLVFPGLITGSGERSWGYGRVFSELPAIYSTDLMTGHRALSGEMRKREAVSSTKSSNPPYTT
jgi:hypothetical protein